MTIRSKRRMLELLEAGALGNTVRTWRTLEELERSGYLGRVGIRSARTFGGACYPSLDQLVAGFCYRQLCEAGAQPYLYESPCDELLVLQGEVQETSSGLYLRYSTVKKPMRRALADEELNALGLAAGVILRESMSGSDLDDLRELLDLYPEHVVEFSTYSVPVGRLRGRSTLIWEVRCY